MIHDARVEVTCDCDGCFESIHVDLRYVYNSMSGLSGQYDFDEEAINKSVSKEGWKVVDGKHYCEGCADPTKKRQRNRLEMEQF